MRDDISIKEARKKVVLVLGSEEKLIDLSKYTEDGCFDSYRS